MNLLTAWLTERYEVVSPRDFYRCIFPEGSMQKKGVYTKGEYNAIIVAVTDSHKDNGNRKVKRYTVTDDLDAVDLVTESDDFCLCAPITYAGKNRTAENARFLYAFAVDVDKIRTKDGDPYGLENLLLRHIENVKRIPKPTFIVSSGSGIHMYYVLEEPIPLYEDIAKELQFFKRELTRLIWHDTILDIKHPNEVQQEGIYQGFRMPGTVTKTGGRAVAFRIGEKVTMDYLNQFVGDIYKAEKAARIKKKEKKKINLAYAETHFPEWYERRIVRGEKRGVWATNRRVYEWWKKEILNGAQVGHRYYCLMMLAIYARKCSHYDPKHNPDPVTREELEKDCFSFLEPMERMTNDENNHFTTADILDALEAFDDRFTTYPRNSVEFKTAIHIMPNKRNGRKQADHIKVMNFIRDEVVHNTNWNRVGNGRKSKQDVVLEWQRLHPEGRKVDCVRDTGLSKPTVYKHWRD